MRVFLGEKPRRDERAGLANRRGDRGEIIAFRMWRREYVGDPSAQALLALERDDQRERHLALAQIGERILAGIRGETEVELVIDRLKRDAEVEPETFECGLRIFVEARGACA